MNRILIVDDEPGNVLLLESILTDTATIGWASSVSESFNDRRGVTR